MARSAAVAVALRLVLAGLAGVACGRGAPMERPRLGSPDGAAVSTGAGAAPGACSLDGHAVAPATTPAHRACGPQSAAR